MADTQDDSQHPETPAAPETPRTDVAAGAAPGTDVTVSELREWMRNWVQWRLRARSRRSWTFSQWYVKAFS